MEVSYNFDTPLLKDPWLRRLAREHVAIAQLKSDRIKWRVVSTVKLTDIPNEYEVDYYVNSIIGINEDESPIYGEKHTVRITLPAKFPIETFVIKAVSDIWHPNIQWHGPSRGRVCGNNGGFGAGYNSYLLLIRIGEIIQYKNYLAEQVYPYPEDSTVAKWVLRYAEPNNIVNIKNKKATDDSNLLDYTEPDPEKITKKIVIKSRTKNKIQIKNIKNKE